MASARLTTEVEDRGGVKLIHLSGPLDSMTHDSLKDLMDPLVAQPDFHIVLDCEKLSYVNSRGITLLVRYQRSTGQSRSFFGIAALNRRIAKGIELLGMTNMIKHYPTVEEALRAASAL